MIGAPVEMPLDPLFGEWFVCADRCAHYFLRGECLCDRKRVARAPATKAPAREARNFVEAQRPECARLNSDRWSGRRPGGT